MSSAAHEHIISGIFIKHVLNDSLAKDKSLLKTGDHILEVCATICVCEVTDMSDIYTSAFSHDYLWLHDISSHKNKKLHDDVETVTEFSYLGDRTNSGVGCVAAVASRTRL